MEQPDQQQQVLEELQALRRRVSELEARQQQSTPKRRSRTALVLGVLTAAAVGTAWAANGACPNGMPFCFSANAPALASDVNTNFAYLRESLVAKTGQLDAGTITSTGATINGQLTVNNAVIVGNNTSGNFHLNTLPATGTMYLNWHSGSGGVVFGNGASAQAGRIDAAGNLTAATVNATTSLTTPALTATNGTITNLTVDVVNGRRLERTLGATCVGGSCTATCPAGTVVKMAFGFHGGAWNTKRSNNPWQCNNVYEWMGQCMGQTSCTISGVACAESSVWLECW